MFNKNNNKGFSLIELSIVLIIMGLLVAGVTGGASLIKSAKIRSVCDDYLNYKNAYNSYYAQFSERPGMDTNGTFMTGQVFAKLVDAGIVDGSNVSGSEVKVTKLKDKNAKFEFIQDAGNMFESGTETVLLSLTSVTADEGKSIVQKIDDGYGDSGSIRANYKSTGGETETTMNSTKDFSETAPNGFSLFMKMDF